jgi:DNA-binding NtrC family response regulator
MPVEPFTVLVVDDEPALREVLSLRVEDWGYAVATASDAAEAEHLMRSVTPDVVLSDVVLPGTSGVDLLKRLKQRDEALPVILITAHGNVDAAVDAMKAGATDFLTKPIDYATLRTLLEEIAADVHERERSRELIGRLAARARPGGLVGESRAMRKLYRMIELLASSDASAIITGESGTGKEVVARTVHQLSSRRDGPFIAVNTAAIPEGLIESEIFGHEQGAFTGAMRARAGCFELANGGTLFLDEIGEMPMALQPRLLRILEDGRARRLGGSRELAFDVRVLAATSRQPVVAVRDGLLRDDLFYRLNVFELILPPLRERIDDLPLLAQHFIQDFNRKHHLHVDGIRDTAQQALDAYAWPGNVRELRNVIERAVIVARAGSIDIDHLPPYMQVLRNGGPPVLALPAGVTLAEAERLLILHTLERVGNNKAEAARHLGIDVKTIRNKLRAYQQEPTS